MKLVLHQVRKDAAHLRVWLVVWLLRVVPGTAALGALALAYPDRLGPYLV